MMQNKKKGRDSSKVNTPKEGDKNKKGIRENSKEKRDNLIEFGMNLQSDEESEINNDLQNNIDNKAKSLKKKNDLK
jgi:hypothetical protein